MGFWDKSLRIFTCLCANAQQSVRQLAQQTGLSTSSVHRLQQAMDRRNGHPESWCWETEEGRSWFTRLVVATLSLFGLKRGVGAETISEFFTRLCLETQGGCSPSALRGVRRVLAETVCKTAQTWEQDGVAHGAVRASIGGADETCFQRMMLVLQDVSTGDLLREDVADDRTYTTGKAGVDERLTALGTEVSSMGSDRATALIQRAETGFACLSMPDLGTHLRRDTMCHNSFRLLKPRPPVTGIPGVFE